MRILAECDAQRQISLNGRVIRYHVGYTGENLPSIMPSKFMIVPRPILGMNKQINNSSDSPAFSPQTTTAVGGSGVYRTYPWTP